MCGPLQVSYTKSNEQRSMGLCQKLFELYIYTYFKYALLKMTRRWLRGYAFLCVYMSEIWNLLAEKCFFPLVMPPDNITEYRSALLPDLTRQGVAWDKLHCGMWECYGCGGGSGNPTETAIIIK